MKKSVKAVIAAATAAAVLLGSGAAAFAAQKNEETKTVTEVTEEVKEETVSSNEEVSKETEEKEDILSNDEVVYVFTDANGNVNKVMDSIWIEDDSDKVQDAKAADLPLTVKVEYKLDGKAVKPENLKGKSGHLEVNVNFENNRFEYKEINGEEEKVYVPFLASTVTALDNEKYTNVTVSNGRVVYDGARYAVVGVALPGLKEDLNIGTDEVEIFVIYFAHID